MPLHHILLEAMKIAAVAEAYEVNCAPHNSYGHMSALMSAHFCAAIPNFRGFPEYCQVPAPRLYRGIVSSMLDLMPAPHLIYNEWDKHGTCSGLAPRAYFDTVRKAPDGIDSDFGGRAAIAFTSLLPQCSNAARTGSRQWRALDQLGECGSLGHVAGRIDDDVVTDHRLGQVR